MVWDQPWTDLVGHTAHSVSTGHAVRAVLESRFLNDGWDGWFGSCNCHCEGSWFSQFAFLVTQFLSLTPELKLRHLVQSRLFYSSKCFWKQPFAHLRWGGKCKDWTSHCCCTYLPTSRGKQQPGFPALWDRPPFFLQPACCTPCLLVKLRVQDMAEISRESGANWAALSWFLWCQLWEHVDNYRWELCLARFLCCSTEELLASMGRVKGSSSHRNEPRRRKGWLASTERWRQMWLPAWSYLLPLWINQWSLAGERSRAEWLLPGLLKTKALCP